jgi:hypothetical protein
VWAAGFSDNRYFPLEPGTAFRLRGDVEDAVEYEKITVTARTKEILGVATTVVKDVIKVDGELVELTYDPYAQDSDGNVWYFGEDTAEYEDGRSFPGRAHGNPASTGLRPASS